MSDNRKIGIFDSGIGGITVLKEIIKILPEEDYIYYSDSKNNPYGDKTETEIIECCENITEFFIKNNCKAIVIACNTASAVAAKYLREKYKNIVFIAIEPAYKMVYDYAFENPTLVMATKGTIKSEKFNDLISKYDNHKTEILGCVGLAETIEKGEKTRIREYLEENLQSYKGKIKNVVLGCTHYPLIKKEIKEVLGDVMFFDGSYSVAKNLKRILEEKNIQGKNKGKIEFVDSTGVEEKEKRFFDILNN